MFRPQFLVIVRELVSFFDMCGVHKLLMSKFPEDVKELKPKHVGEIITKRNIVQHVGVKYYVYSQTVLKYCFSNS